MAFKGFNLLVIALVMVLAGLCAFINRALNIYGLFGDVRGSSYFVLGNTRFAKYLYSFNYIPSNFESLLVGSSISENWDTSAIHGERVYNASMSGANISEEALIIENILRRRRIKTVIFVIHPYITETFGQKSGYMCPKQYWAALGSIQLLSAYAEKWAISRGRLEQNCNAFGQYRFYIPQAPQPNRTDLGEVQKDFTIDERAYEQYRALLARSRMTGARVIGVIPLVLTSQNSPAAAYEHYNNRMRELFLPTERVIDLNQCPELGVMRTDSACFQDGCHYTTDTADRIVSALDRYLR